MPDKDENRLSKAATLDVIHGMLYQDGGDIISQDTLWELQHIVAYQLGKEEQHGACKLTKLGNGFIKEVEEIPVNPPVVDAVYASGVIRDFITENSHQRDEAIRSNDYLRATCHNVIGETALKILKKVAREA